MYWRFVYKSLAYGDRSRSFTLCSNSGLFFFQPMTLGFLFGKALSLCLLGGGLFLFLGNALMKAGVIEKIH